MQCWNYVTLIPVITIKLSWWTFQSLNLTREELHSKEKCHYKFAWASKGSLQCSFLRNFINPVIIYGILPAIWYQLAIQYDIIIIFDIVTLELIWLDNFLRILQCTVLAVFGVTYIGFPFQLASMKSDLYLLRGYWCILWPYNIAQ